MTPITRRRIQNFKANKRAFWSLWLFLFLFVFTLFSDFIANDKPIFVKFDGEYRFPIWQFYSEYDYGGDYQTEADYLDPAVQCLIRTNGDATCFSNANLEGDGRIFWAPVRYRFDTIAKNESGSYQPPSQEHWFGTDGQSRDVFARVIYGFRLTVFFALIVSFFSSVIAILLGGIMGYFGGRIDLIMQRFVEIWSAMPILYIMILISSLLPVGFMIMCLLVIVFSWMGLTGLVRAEFLRARNFEYVRAAKALGVSDFQIMWRHVLPNAMVATITFLPFIITSAVGTLAALDFFNFGLPASYPSLGELAREARSALQAWWLIWAAFFTYALLLALLVFIFEGVRDAFDPRKVFS